MFCSHLRANMNAYTLQGINISHLGKRKIIFKMLFLGDMLVPWRVYVLFFKNWFYLAISNFTPTDSIHFHHCLLRQDPSPEPVSSEGFGCSLGTTNSSRTQGALRTRWKGFWTLTADYQTYIFNGDFGRGSLSNSYPEGKFEELM